MKNLIVFAFLIIAAANAELSQEYKEHLMGKIQEVGAACAETEKASGDDIGELLQKLPPSRKEGKCLISCVNQKLGIQTADGQITMESALKALEPVKAEDPEIFEKMKKSYEKCMPEIKGMTDRCDIAAKMAECGKKVGPEVGLSEEIFM